MSDLSIADKIAAIMNIDNIEQKAETESNQVLDLDKIATQYGGKAVGDFIIDNKIQMTRKEYIELTKHMTQEDLFKSPLLFVIFRAEGQVESNFIHWCNSF